MKNLQDGQADTILDLVNQIFQAGEFVYPLDIVRDSEIVIGELSDYEKAILTAARQVQEIHNGLVEKEIETEEEGDYVQKFLNKSAHEAYNALLWSSIYHRLGTLTVKNEKLGVRKDWKIVAIPEVKNNHKDCASCPMALICPDAD